MSKKQEAWIRPLKLLVSCLYAHDLKVFLDAGTLLAVVRDGRLFPQLDDEDLDLSLVINLEVIERLREAVKEIREMEETTVVAQDAFGLHVRMKTSFSAWRRFNLTVMYVLNRIWSDFPNSLSGLRQFAKTTFYYWWHTREMIVNITFFRNFREVCWSAGYKTYLRAVYGAPPVDYIARTAPRDLFRALDGFDIFGLEVLIPKDSSRRLEQLYGPDWVVPRVSWNYWLESGEVDLEFAQTKIFHFIAE